MICGEFHARVHAYLDGELAVDDIAAAGAHAADCPGCADLARREREFRHLLGRQPREAAPRELRAAIVESVRRERAARARRILAASAAAVAAAVLVVVVFPVRPERGALLAELVDKHIVYAQIDRPAELASSDRGEIRRWFLQRANLPVTVPDYSSAGIRLIGARLAEARGQRTAYLLYEKGRTLMSVFMVPVSEHDTILRGPHVKYRGREYVTTERKGYRTVSWSEGGMVFGLVSMLDDEALLECADRLRIEHAGQAPL